jgi:pyruvate/2-oxoglutarate/acetoin dehydrogenase E1 component
LTTLTAASEEEYSIPFGVADIKRKGTDVTVVATLYMLHLALRAAETLAEEGISVEVIDPRTVVPLDKDTILNSVAKTGRLVVASEDAKTCGFASEIAALAAEECLDSLKTPIRRVCTLDVPIPFAPESERAVLPSEEEIANAIRKTVLSRKVNLDAERHNHAPIG